MKKRRLISARATVLAPGGSGGVQFVRNGELAYDQNGIIAHCGRAKNWREKPARLRLPPGAVIMPGLIDCHTHLSQYHVRGRTGHTLMQWLSDYVFPAEASFRDRGYARKVAEGFFAKLLSNGVTTTAVYASFRGGAEEAVGAAVRSGIRAVIGMTLMDRGVPKGLRQRPDRAIEDCRHVAGMTREKGGGRLFFSVNPRFAPACSPGFMNRIGRFAEEEGCYIQTHLSENSAEISLVKRLFPGAASYAEVYDRYGLLTPRTLLAHCIHLSPAEQRLVRKRGCAVVHCPSSNLFLHSGRFPMERWRDHEKLCLGTDVGAGPSFSMLDCMRDAYFVNQAEPESLFHLATVGGAKALGMEGEIGSLEPGKKADFSVVTVSESEMRGGREVLSDLVFKWDQVRVHKVFVGGREVFSAGR